MRVLFVSSIFPDADHPARGTFNYEMCCALQRSGTDVKVIAPQAWPEVWKQRWQGKPTQPTSGMQDNQLSVEYPVYWYPPKVARNFYGKFFWQSMRRTANRMIKNWQPDLILSYWAHPDGEAGLRLAQQSRVPCAVIIGGSDVLLITKNKARKNQVVNVLKNSDAVLTVSQSLAEVVKSLGTSPQNALPVYQGIDPQKFFPGDQQEARLKLGLDPNRPLAVWVGRMVPVKNLDMLVSAAKILSTKVPEIQFCLLGDGPESVRIQEQIQNQGLENQVRLVGSVGHQILPTWYRAADCVVLCSHSEGLPNVLRESLACGTPFVSTDVGSISEISNPESSILVPPGDSEAMASALLKIINGNFRSQAQQTPARTWNDMASELLEIFQRLCGQQNPVEQTSQHFQQNCPDDQANQRLSSQNHESCQVVSRSL